MIKSIMLGVGLLIGLYNSYAITEIINKPEEIVVDIEDTNEEVKENSYIFDVPDSTRVREFTVNGIKYTNILNEKETQMMIDDVIKASKSVPNAWVDGKQNFEIKVEYTDMMQEAYFYPYMYERTHRYVNLGYKYKFSVIVYDYYVNDEFSHTLYYIK